MQSRPSRESSIAVCDVWYSKELSDQVDSLQSVISPFWFSIVSRSALLRAFTLLFVGRHYPLILTCWDGTGRFLAVICGVLNLKKLVILEFIDFDYHSKPPLISKAYQIIIARVLRPCAMRSIVNTQVFTAWEKASVSEKYGLEERRVKLFSWPLSLGEIRTRPQDEAPASQMVFSSGRAACDWETLFAAFHLGTWPLTVVCTAKDLPLVSSLNQDGRATVLTDIPKEEHDRLFASATVYVLCLKEKMKSAGQIRLASSIEAGVPVVAANIRGLDGYLHDGVTGVAYPPGDAQAMSSAISRLLDHPDERQALVARALDFAKSNTRQAYMDDIRTLLRNSAQEVGDGRSSADGRGKATR